MPAIRRPDISSTHSLRRCGRGRSTSRDFEVIGEPASIVEGVRTTGSGRFTSGAAHFSFSGDGAMAYVPGTAREASPTRSLVLIDLNGKVKPLDLPAGRYHSPRFSLPDGKQIALYTSDGVIWIYDLSGTKPIRRLTLEGGHLLPMWTRDGRVVFRSNLVDGQAGLFWQRADGSAVAERLTEPGVRSYFPYSVSAGREDPRLTDRSQRAQPAQRPRTRDSYIVPDWRYNAENAVPRSQGRSDVQSNPFPGRSVARI